jgi:hypothetical protein
LNEFAHATVALLQTTDGPLDEAHTFDIDMCGAFIKMNTNTKFIEPVHFSVTKYLTSQLLPNGEQNKYYIKGGACNGELLRACLSYLSSPFMEREFNTCSEMA